jgi:hypothetical protein
MKPRPPPCCGWEIVHELAHEMLHKAERRTATTKVVKETEAEAIAFVIGKAVGLETGSASADYASRRTRFDLRTRLSTLADSFSQLNLDSRRSMTAIASALLSTKKNCLP